MKWNNVEGQVCVGIYSFSLGVSSYGQDPLMWIYFPIGWSRAFLKHQVLWVWKAWIIYGGEAILKKEGKNQRKKIVES